MYTYKKTAAVSAEEKAIRTAVFVEEQGFKIEFDKLDAVSQHLVFYDKEIPFGVCRYYTENKPGEFIAGRIAVIRSYRGKNAGSAILHILEQCIVAEGGTLIRLSAQLKAQPFYQKNGYISLGKPYFDEHCEHITMIKHIGSH